MNANPRGHLYGLILVALIAAVAACCSEMGWLRAHGISALTLAILLGMVIGNTVYPYVAATSHAGVGFAKQTLLRAGIVLYGLRLTFQDIGHVGIEGVAIDALVLSTTFGLSWWFGTRVLGLDHRTTLLIGAGSSICGAAAVMAAEPVVHGRAEQVTVAVATVVVFGTVALFLYPLLYHVAGRWGLPVLTPATYGVYAGSTIHEVAQVLAAGRAVSEAAAATAVITKLVRVMMLAPFLLILSAWLSRSGHRDPHGHTDARPGRITIPWFALGFVAVAGINSLQVLPRAAVGPLVGFDNFILAMAMGALGLTTHVAAIRTAGIRPLALAAVLFAWLVVGGAAINAAITTLRL